MNSHVLRHYVMDSNFKAGVNILLWLFFLIFDEDNLRVTREGYE